MKLSCVLNSRHTTLYLCPSIRLGSGPQLSRAKLALLCGAAMLEIQPIEGSGSGHRVWPHCNVPSKLNIIPPICIKYCSVLSLSFDIPAIAVLQSAAAYIPVPQRSTIVPRKKTFSHNRSHASKLQPQPIYIYLHRRQNAIIST